MRKVPRFLLVFIILFLFALVISLIYRLRIAPVERVWLLYTCIKDILLYLPLLASLSILWSLVFRSKNEAGGVSSKSRFVFSFIFYVIFSFAFAFFMNEFAISRLEEMAYHSSMVQKQDTSRERLTDETGDKFTLSEFRNLRLYPFKENVTFMMGRALVNMGKLYNADGIFYITDLKVIAYDTNKNIDYIVAGQYAKVVDNQIVVHNPTYYEYSRGRIRSTKELREKRNIPLIYNIKGVYSLSSKEQLRDISMLNIILYYEYVYGSKINFQRIGNVIYNKVSYYVIMIFLLIVCSSAGWAMRNTRITQTKDIFQMVSFYIVSFVVVTLCYDLLIRMMNMIYGLVAL